MQITVDLPYPVEVVWSALTERRWLGEWFLPTDLAPVAGGVLWAFPPPGLAGFTAPFAIDVIEMVAPQRLVMRFRGEQLHANVRWELAARADRSRLTVAQTSFLSPRSERRHAEILGTYQLMFQQRLPAVLSRLAIAHPTLVVAAAPPSVVRASSPVPEKAMPKEKPLWRARALSILGAMILTVLIVSTIATMMLSRPGVPAGGAAPQRGPATAIQPGISSGAADRSVQISSSTASPGSAFPSSSSGPATDNLFATYRTDDNDDRTYTGSITIQAGSEAVTDWTATIELPPGAIVTSAWDEVEYRQKGNRVTFTPDRGDREVATGSEFTFFFKVTEEVAVGAPVSCSVNEVPCAGLA